MLVVCIRNWSLFFYQGWQVVCCCLLFFIGFNNWCASSAIIILTFNNQKLLVTVTSCRMWPLCLQKEIVLIFLGLTSKVLILKVWSKNPWSTYEFLFFYLFLPGWRRVQGKEPRYHKYVHNNIEALFAFLLSLSHKYTEKFSRDSMICVVTTDWTYLQIRI